MMFKRAIFYLTLFCICFTSCKQKTTSFVANNLWQPGYLDIHFIHSGGGGNTSFMVFPDGTTMLYDMGESKKREKYPYYPPYDTLNISIAERVANYIKHFSPNKKIDYAVISHFHSDHYGKVLESTPQSPNGKYKQTGITAIGDLIPISTIIDRAYPDYNYPLDLKMPNGKEDKTMINYCDYIEYHQENSSLKVEQLVPGAKDQIILKHNNKYLNFHIRNIKSNDKIWSGNYEDVTDYNFIPPLVNDKGYYNENPLGIVLKVNYGDFDYLMGGDLPGVNDYPDYDIESAISKAVGEVDAMSLNHHGYKDASNLNFLKTLNPQVIAHQALHDPHFASNVQENLLKTNADVFTFFMSDSIKNIYKEQVKKRYKGINGNFFIRVYPEGEEFSVFTLDPNSNEFRINNQFGFYKSRK